MTTAYAPQWQLTLLVSAHSYRFACAAATHMRVDIYLRIAAKNGEEKTFRCSCWLLAHVVLDILKRIKTYCVLYTEYAYAPKIIIILDAYVDCVYLPGYLHRTK